MASPERVILLVEDSPNDAALILRGLKKGGISNEIHQVQDGVEALEYLLGTESRSRRPQKGLPAIVLLDLKMPRMGGLEVLQRLRADERTKRLPVVILTSSKEERDVLDGYDMGANSYIQKPVDFIKFAKAVEQLGLYWLVLNEPPPSRKEQS